MLNFQQHLKSLYQPKSALHQLAWDHFLELGLPTKAMEVYRYVKLSDLYKNRFSLPQHDEYKSPSESTFLFVNGSYAEKLSSPPKQIIALPLSKAFKTYGHFLNPRLMKQFKDESDPFAVLNGALYGEGLFIYIPPNAVCERLSIQHIIEETALVSPRIHIFVGKGATLTLEISQKIQTSAVFINSFIDFALEERAQVKLVSRLEEQADTWHFDTIRATLKQESHFKSYAVTHGGATSRQDYWVRLLGERSEASLNGVWDLDDGRHHHVNILMEHQEPNCTSLQKFKGVLRGTSRSSFEGKIYVHQKAQKTQAYQMNPNLILSKYASANSKPNLEIYADDVKASHGATVGQLDEEQLFYFTTRGISKERAQHLLVQGFIQEILDQI